MSDRATLERYAQAQNSLHRSVKEQYIDKLFSNIPSRFKGGQRQCIAWRYQAVAGKLKNHLL